MQPADASTPTGPLGHHMSCDFFIGPDVMKDMRSFRFTCRIDDLKWVMDLTFPRDPATGRVRTLDAAKAMNIRAASQYDVATAPVYDSMTALLMNVKEISDLATTGSIVDETSGVAATAAARAASLGIPTNSVTPAKYL